MVTQDKLIETVRRNVSIAKEALKSIQLMSKFAANEGMAADLPAQRRLLLGHATKAWCAILFVDLRGSTNRAEKHGPGITFVTMHALIPALAYLVKEFNGYIVGFRGDGLFACFGIDQHGSNPENLNKGQTIVEAAQCGQAMVEAVDEIVNPVLNYERMHGDLHIGAGLDAGEVIFTKIGLPGAFEITAYANAVNKASKLANVCQDYVHISDRANDLFPTSPGGKIKMGRTSGDGYKIQFPEPILVPASTNKVLLEAIVSGPDSLVPMAESTMRNLDE